MATRFCFQNRDPNPSRPSGSLSWAATRLQLPTDDTETAGRSLSGEARKGLYEGTGFPQVVQGKRGENRGESNMRFKPFILY
jgi:hypothetical protein